MPSFLLAGCPDPEHELRLNDSGMEECEPVMFGGITIPGRCGMSANGHDHPPEVDGSIEASDAAPPPDFRGDANDMAVDPPPRDAMATGCDRPPDEVEGTIYDADVPWLETAPGTANRRIDPDEIRRVLFIGDGALVELPGEREPGRSSEFATIRGRLTRRLALHTLLTAPEIDEFAAGASWYAPDADGNLVSDEQGSFHVCAQRGALWHDLHSALHDARPADDNLHRDAADLSLSSRCLDQLVGDGDGMLLIIVVFGAYGPDQLAADEERLDAPAARDGGLDPLGRRVGELLAALRERYLEPGRGGFDEVVLVTSDLPVWRADAMPCTVCNIDPAKDDPFNQRLVAFNRTLVDLSHRHGFDVVLTDAAVRDRGALCLQAAGGEPAACGSLPDAVTLEEADDLPHARLDGCCWTEHDACDRPDLDGHLGIAGLFEAVIRGLATLPSR
ncbi:MAG: hypothetical protein R3F65_00065 [bacterium]